MVNCCLLVCGKKLLVIDFGNMVRAISEAESASCLRAVSRLPSRPEAADQVRDMAALATESFRQCALLVFVALFLQVFIRYLLKFIDEVGRHCSLVGSLALLVW